MDFRRSFQAGYVVDNEYFLKNGRFVRLYRLSGVDFLSATPQILNKYENLIKKFERKYSYEFHLIRSSNQDLVDDYDAVTSSNIIREKEFTEHFRNLNSSHHRRFGKKNNIYLSIISPINKNVFKTGVADKSLILELDNHVENLHSIVSLDKQEVSKLVAINSYLANHIQQDISENINNSYNSIPEQIISDVPALTDDSQALLVNKHYVKSCIVHLYPSSFIGFFESIAFLNSAIHIKLTLKLINKQAFIKQENRKHNPTQKDDEADELASGANKNFNLFIQEHNCELFKNQLVITVKNKNKRELYTDFNVILNHITNYGGIINDNKRLLLNTYIHSFIGENFLSFSRVDHSKLIAELLPLNVSNNKYCSADILRLSSRGNLFALNYAKDAINHGFTIGKSGGGKDAEKILQIAETFGLGYDYYITEIDPSYRFIVELLGGNYIDVDPSETVVNPFPAFSVEVDTEMISLVVDAITSLLTDQPTLTQTEAFIAEIAVENLYKNSKYRGTSVKSPTFESFRESLHDLEQEPLKKEQKKSLEKILLNLESFIDSPSGKIFKQDSNLELSDNICGVNLKKVTSSKNKQLSIFYLNFISLQFKFLAEKKTSNSIILLNELHEFSTIAPNITYDLIRRLSRMGRKGNCILEIVTQDIGDLDFQDGILNNMTRKKFVYMEDGHEAVAKKFPKIGAALLDNWKNLSNPDDLRDYRQQLISIGDNSEILNITMPSEILKIASTSAEMLRKKEVILRSNNSRKEKLQQLLDT